MFLASPVETQGCWEGSASPPWLCWPAGGQLLLSFAGFALHLPVITFSLLTCKVSHFPPAACVHLRMTVNPNRENTFDEHHCCHQPFSGVVSLPLDARLPPRHRPRAPGEQHRGCSPAPTPGRCAPAALAASPPHTELNEV